MNRAALRSALEGLAFSSAGSSTGRNLIGAEVEMLVADAATGAAAPIGLPGSFVIDDRPASRGTDATPPTLSWLRPLAAREGWAESCTPKGVPCFRLADGSTIGFEPGGQLEYSTSPHSSASELLRKIEAVTGLLHAAAVDVGIALLHVGIDPTNPIERVPLELGQPRYARMDAYLASRGESGRRMMRQTAATQVAIDLGSPTEMLERWRVLNAVVPWLVAMFANSPRYAGRDTGARSHRAHVWRTLDAARTGVVGIGGDPVAEYLDFALAAPAMFHEDAAGGYEPFEQLACRGVVGEHEWIDHLSTLFPEIRPRGYFEVRSVDAVPLEWLPALFGMIGGIAYDARSTRAALDLLPVPDPAMLVAAGKLGLEERVIARHARDLFDIALEGCVRLGDRFLAPEHLEQMRAIGEHRTTPIFAAAAPPRRR